MRRRQFGFKHSHTFSYTLYINHLPQNTKLLLYKVVIRSINHFVNTPCSNRRILLISSPSTKIRPWMRFTNETNTSSGLDWRTCFLLVSSTKFLTTIQTLTYYQNFIQSSISLYLPNINCIYHTNCTWNYSLYDVKSIH